MQTELFCVGVLRQTQNIMFHRQKKKLTTQAGPDLSYGTTDKCQGGSLRIEVKAYFLIDALSFPGKLDFYQKIEQNDLNLSENRKLPINGLSPCKSDPTQCRAQFLILC